MKNSLLSITLLIYSSVLCAQDFSELTYVSWHAFPIIRSTTGDLDGDGDMDLLVAAVNRSLTWYENNQDGTFLAEHVINDDGLNFNRLVIADLDSDGDQDILSQGYNAENLVWLSNDGIGGFSEVYIIASGLSSIDLINSADLDGDNDLDLIATAIYDQTIFWVENLGGGQFGPVSMIDNAAVYTHALKSADLDGDGDTDILASPNGFSITWYENDGNGSFGNDEVITQAVEAVDQLYAADFDGDLDLDILSLSNEDNKIAWYSNEGNGSFSNQIIIYDDLFSLQIDADLSDFENDDDIDLIISFNSANTILRFRNDGIGNFSLEEEIFFSDNMQPEHVMICELDADGYGDLIVEGPGVIKSLLNTNGQVLAEPQIVTPHLDCLQNANVGDLDGDGDIEIVGASQCNDRIVFYEDPWAGEHSNLHIVSDSILSPHDVFVADMDGDLDLDIGYLSHYNYSMGWLENNGSAAFSVSHSVSTGSGAQFFMESLDLDLDGDNDIIARLSNNYVKFFENQGDGTFNTPTQIFGPQSSGDVAWGDMDLDGDIDFIITSAGGVGVLSNNGNESFTSSFSSSFPFGFTGQFVAVGDMDNNSKLDIVVASTTSGLLCFKNLGNNQYQMSSVVPEITTNVGGLEAVDFDGDGKMDILSSLQYWLKNEGADEYTLHSLSADDSGFFGVNDLDEDGDVDIYVSGGPTLGVFINLIGEGCTDPNACNYNPNASNDDGSCNYYQPGDFNCDGIIGSDADIDLFLSSFGCVGSCDPFDLDGDGIVGTNDLMLFFALIGE
ncbi:MAG: FG-GAP-like repeat-containing protein [Flavobacteriales bacterium]